MTSDMERSMAFTKLQPICVTVTKQPNKENILKLDEELKKLDVDLLQDFQEYVIFPLRVVFKQTKIIEEETYIKTCECLKYIFDNTTISNWQMVQDLFTTFCFLVNPPNQDAKEENKSEEFMLVLLNCISSLIVHTEWSTLQHLYEPTSLPALGHAVSVLLKEAELERSRSLQIAALNCLDSLAQTHRKVGRSERQLLGDILASFLPGISMALTRVITGDSKQGHAVIVKALDTWSKITGVVMNNEGLQDENNATVKTETKVNEKIKGLMIVRNEEWFAMTTNKLIILLKEIITIRINNNWRVRMALVESADLLLKKCNRTMTEEVPILLDVLVGYIGDDYSNIRNKALSTLEQFKQRQTDVLDSRALQEILAENLHNLTTALPRQIRMADEEEKLSIVNLLNGYLTLLGKDINKVLRSMAHLRRLFLSLVQALELDCSDIRIIEHHSLSLDSTKESDISKPVKVFKHLRDNKIESGLYQTCSLLGQYGDCDVIVDHVLDIFHETSIYRLQAILVINNIVQGLTTTQNTEERKMGIIRMLAEEYLSDANFDLPVTNINAGYTNDSIQPKMTKPALTLANMNTNIMQICLILEGIGTFAKVAGREFDSMLIDVMYPVLDKLGLDSNYINNTAYLTLIDITTACHYRSIDELIRKNSDYLVNAISLKLRQHQDGYRAPRVLQVMIQYSSSEIIPLIHDTVQEILESLDDNYEEGILIYLNVLKELVISVNRWFPHKQKNQKDFDDSKISRDKLHLDDECKRFEKLSIEDIEKYFKEYHKNKEIENSLNSLEEEAEEGDEPMVEEEGNGQVDPEASESNKELPYHIIAVQQILTRTKHLLSSKNGRERLLVLQIIQHSVTALKNNTDELLPLLHELWVPFSLRFSDEEKLVTVKAMETLTIMVENSGDFLMKRVVKNIFPVIKQFLSNQSRISIKSGSMYTYTVNYKLQLIYLQSLGPLAYRLKLQAYDLDVLVSSCIPYLTCQQPTPLQQACIKTFDYLINLDCDIVWLALNNVYRVTSITPPSPLFKPLVLKGSEKDNNDYKENVKLLLLSIDNKIL